jgi:pectate lyase
VSKHITGITETILSCVFTQAIADSTIRIKDANNVIVRNMNFGWPLDGQASLSIQGSTQVWVVHNDFNMGQSLNEDDFGAEVEIIASDRVTVSWNLFMQGVSLMDDTPKGEQYRADR